MARRWYPVEVTGVENHARTRHQLVFHAINKSGSAALTAVLYDAYVRANRANQFLSTYRKVPADLDRLRDIIGASSGHSFFLAHYLYGSYGPRPRQLLLTMFRNPLPRARSCYQWLRDRHGLEDSFEQWMVASGGVAHTQMQQFAIGYADDRPDWTTMSPEQAFDRAVAALERDVAWCGLAERFEESIHVVAAMCGLPRVPVWRRDDRNKNRPLVDDWEPGEVEMVRELHAWEFRLYEWVVERFDRQLETVSFGPQFAAYQAACAGEYKDRLDTSGLPIDTPRPAG